MTAVNHPTYLALNTYTKLMRAAESVTSRVNRSMAAFDLTLTTLKSVIWCVVNVTVKIAAI